MTDITAELDALPKMPDVASDEQYLWEVISFFETRLALAERQLAGVLEHGIGFAARVVRMDEARAYLAHRAKEQP